MAFCINCGAKLQDNAKFCHACGAPNNHASVGGQPKREFEYEGKIIKCPNCGEPLASFHSRCPACGHEFREAKVSSVVKEFASKLEAIEAQRDPNHKGSKRKKEAANEISEKEAQKIELIKSFPVPNTKEDMLEFMILATSCINYDQYDSCESQNAAWFAKVQQVYEKAKRSNFSANDFSQIESLYTKCKDNIRHAKKKGVRKIVLTIVGILLLWVVAFSILPVSSYIEKTNEIKRLETIVIEVQEALTGKEYKHALRLAESIQYEAYDDALETEWAIKRDYWIDKVIDTAAENGVILEYTPKEEEPELTWDEIVDAFDFGEEATTAPTATPTPPVVSRPTIAPHPIEKGAVYTYGYDEFNLYCATAISDSLITIEKWEKSLSTQKSFKNEYEVGTFRITDADNGFVWLNDEHTVFEFTLLDDAESDFRKPKKVVFTISGVDGDTNKGTNYDKNIDCYWYEHDDWYQYRAFALAENLIKIECWYRPLSIGGFNYGYDIAIIDLNAPVMDFAWTDEEHTSFTITLQDTEISDLKKGKFVAFTLDK